jgi:hypothetical protein
LNKLLVRGSEGDMTNFFLLLIAAALFGLYWQLSRILHFLENDLQYKVGEAIEDSRG